ncbi:MAG: hypothetical protein AAFX39_15035 [Pseudomonadota bacterium]
MSGRSPDQVDDVEESPQDDQGSRQINDNVISNNAAILLTDEAESTVNFLYVNPIEFFNGGRASDITLNFGPGSSDGSGMTETGLAVSDVDDGDVVDDTQDDTASDADEGSQFNDNLIGNNGAIILTDEAESVVNFLYINPIEFFNNGRASDIVININTSDDASSDDASPDAAAEVPLSLESDLGEDPEPTTDVAGDFLPSIDWHPDDLTTEDAVDLAVEILDQLGQQNDSCSSDTFGFPTPFGLASPPSLLDALGVPDIFDFDNGVGDDVSDTVLDIIDDTAGDATEINGNIIGNNAAILLTDEAQSTVNFLYINPIQFFNDGRGGDITLNITLDEGSEFFVL